MDGLWLFTVAAGPIILAVAFIFALSRRRRLNPREQQRQHNAVNALYERDDPGPPKEERQSR